MNTENRIYVAGHTGLVGAAIVRYLNKKGYESLILKTRDDFSGPVNLGNPEEYTIWEIAEQVLSLTGSRSEITYRPLPKDDPKRRCPNISLAKQQLKWTPETTLNEGLKHTIEWFHNNPARP